MLLDLPPMTLEGARVLHRGALRDGSLGVVNGRIAAAGAPAVDLSGYAIMPGAIDLGIDLGPGPSEEGGLETLAHNAARAGTTTGYVTRRWNDTSARQAFDPLKRASAGSGLDLRARLIVGSHDFDIADQLVRELDDLGLPAVAFMHRKDASGREIDRDTVGIGRVARHFSGLASAFDAKGVRYGSDGDSTAETREWMSMIGARLAFRPAARQAAATARAMGEPIVLSAHDVLTGGTVRRGLAAALLGEGLCDALGSFGSTDAPLRVVQGLVKAGRVPLGHAWALISSAPAGIMRLSDRGALVEGTRADLAILETATLSVAATVAKGRLVHADPEVLARFEPVFGTENLAAE